MWDENLGVAIKRNMSKKLLITDIALSKKFNQHKHVNNISLTVNSWVYFQNLVIDLILILSYILYYVVYRYWSTVNLSGNEKLLILVQNKLVHIVTPINV